jgi:hypothetical protein
VVQVGLHRKDLFLLFIFLWPFGALAILRKRKGCYVIIYFGQRLGRCIFFLCVFMYVHMKWNGLAWPIEK